MRALIETDRLILRNLEESDFSDAFEWCGDPEVNKYMIYPLYKDEEEVRAWLKRMDHDDPNKCDLGFVLKKENKLIGCGGLVYKKDDDAWSIGYNLNRRYWGNGYVKEAISSIIDYVSKFRDVHIIEGVFAEENHKSQRVMEKLGMSYFSDESFSKLDESATYKAKKFIKIENEIKTYENGDSFLAENDSFLSLNPHTKVFFSIDAPLLKNTNKDEFAISITRDNKKLVILNKEPYNTIYFGDRELSIDAAYFLKQNGYRIKDFLTTTELGDSLVDSFRRLGTDFSLSLGMDFMEATSKCQEVTGDVTTPDESDIDEIYEMSKMFLKDCGLKDIPDKEKMKDTIRDFRIIKEDGMIVSMSKMSKDMPGSRKLSYVYTRNSYRGKGYAKAVCGHMLNEIIDMGYKATLNVDQNNPISYHVYESLGFKKIFSQGIYVLK